MNTLHVKQAIRVCRAGGIIAYPTEAVFGLGCLPLYAHAVYRILNLKHRAAEKGLILVAANIKQLEPFVDFSAVMNNQRVYVTWPGPVSWLIPAKPETPFWLTGRHKTLAVRVSSHPVVKLLCQELGPIVSTSANIQGSEPAKSSRRIRAYFQNKVDYIMPGIIPTALRATEIRDSMSDDIIRHG